MVSLLQIYDVTESLYNLGYKCSQFRGLATDRTEESVCCSLEHHVFCVVKTDAKVAIADHSFHTNYIKLCSYILRFVIDVVASYYYNLYKHVASCVYIFISGLTNRDYLFFQFCFRSPL